ncbi:protein kinase [Candidatus Margulisiibacteriota bacterium]
MSISSHKGLTGKSWQSKFQPKDSLKKKKTGPKEHEKSTLMTKIPSQGQLTQKTIKIEHVDIKKPKLIYNDDKKLEKKEYPDGSYEEGDFDKNNYLKEGWCEGRFKDIYDQGGTDDSITIEEYFPDSCDHLKDWFLDKEEPYDINKIPENIIKNTAHHSFGRNIRYLAEVTLEMPQYKPIKNQLLKKIHEYYDSNPENLFIGKRTVDPTTKETKTLIGRNNSYQIQKKVGSGAFGDVYIAQNKHNETVAIKEMEIDPNKNPERDIIKEVKALHTLKGKYIIPIIDVIKTDNKYFIIMRYANNKDLLDKTDKNKLDIKKKKNLVLLKKILFGIKRLHMAKKIHKDIKPENILLDDSDPFISDLGLVVNTKEFNKKGSVTNVIHTKEGTEYYMSPEVFSEYIVSEKDSYKTDIWSLGKTFEAIIKTIDPSTTDQAEKNYLDLLKNMLKIKPEKRFNVDQCLAHPLFKGIKVK